MSDVTHILSEMDRGDPGATERLLPLVYDELRKLAAAKLAQEKPGQTLQATALVHKVYLWLIGGRASPAHWDDRRHFFAAAAEAMRRGPEQERNQFFFVSAARPFFSCRPELPCIVRSVRCPSRSESESADGVGAAHQPARWVGRRERR
jgi:hypothetical protein